MYHKGGRDHFWLRLSFDPHLATVDCSSFNLKPGPSGPSRGVHDPQWDEDGGAGEHVVELHGASGERRLRASTRRLPGFEAGAVKLLARNGKTERRPTKSDDLFSVVPNQFENGSLPQKKQKWNSRDTPLPQSHVQGRCPRSPGVNGQPRASRMPGLHLQT